MQQIRFSYELINSETTSKGLHNKLIDLLDSIEHRGSLASAVEADFHSSYRHIWNELKKWENHIGQPLVTRGRGKPGQLTPFAKKLLSAVRSVHASYKSQLDALNTDLLQAFAQAIDDTRPTLTLTGCPDVAVMQLKKAALKSSFFLDINFSSSSCGLQALLENRTQITGFNFPLGAGAESSAAQAFRPYLVPEKMKLIQFCTRIQGIAVAKGNPLGIHSLLDVSLKKAKYAQRAEGSGTRVLFNDLLHASGMTPRDINTSGIIANSHTDVATMISQGKADAGICLANIASDADLDFIALSREVYFLACFNELLSSAEGQSFLELLNSSEWREDAAKLPGYDFSNCGVIVDIHSALPWF